MAPKDKEEILKEFRETLVKQDLIRDGDTIGTDDDTLLRFLRARHFNLKQSTIMWKNCQHWRKTVEGVGIDELYRQIDPFDYPERELVFDCWPLYFHKVDKKGRPLNFHHFGGINLNKLQKNMSLERFWRTVLVNCEALTREVLPAAAEAAGRPIGGTFVVVDLAGFGISQFWQMKDFARSSFQVSQDYFPETMAQLAIVNAPMGFSTIWNVMKPWLAKETVAKVAIYGSDYRKALLELIDEDALPASLGGKCTCNGMGGCMKSNAGPWMHERKQRREAWLKGERETMAILPGELHGGVKVGKQENTAGKDEVATPSEQHSADAKQEASSEEAQATSSADTTKETAPADAPTETPSSSEPSPESGSTSETSSLATPASEASHAEPAPAGEPMSKEASVEEVYQHHPDTRVVQTGDLHSEPAALAG
ncbi:CRAL/TRIO domain-containing protein [Trametes coccinea BRFM310]|uniref:CRAL/TRIO domain-containing protein n=1 Tax=Trametes coccinea (strain BRFM310) TaxID=1353009 RepID=A0A1Y2J1I2_TRAC3|nr:CRAL/TRIO domain-containing protein [Trametes coccinea BRFM310]